MRSRANFKAHPLHPALIPFPLAFLTGAVVFDALAMAAGRPAFGTTAAHLALAGIATGLLAAVPGLIDYLYSVPPESSGKTRAMRHGVANSAALVLFGVAFLLRTPEWQPTLAVMALEAVGFGALAYAGVLGGTLVTRNLISVDHRYARAGRWQEISVTGAAGDEVIVADDGDLEDGQMKLLHVNGRRIALARVGTRFYAVDDACSHRGGSLAAGVLIGPVVHCLWHGSQFDVRIGEATCGPADKGIACHQVRVDRGRILLTIPK